MGTCEEVCAVVLPLCPDPGPVLQSTQWLSIPLHKIISAFLYAFMLVLMFT